jgi:hypothetical protein
MTCSSSLQIVQGVTGLATDGLAGSIISWLATSSIITWLATRKRQMSQTNQNIKDSYPNLQKTVETNIPVLAGLLLGFMGALFAGVAVADFS